LRKAHRLFALSAFNRVTLPEETSRTELKVRFLVLLWQRQHSCQDSRRAKESKQIILSICRGRMQA